MQINEDRQITRFVEKPKDPAVQDSLRLPPEWFPKLGVEGDEEKFLASMGIYIFNRDVVRKLLDKVSPITETAQEEEYTARGRPFRDDRFEERRPEYGHGGWYGEQEDELHEDRAEDGLWSDRYEEEAEPEPKPTAPERPTGRLAYAVTTAVAAGSWWLNRHKPRASPARRMRGASRK